MTRIKRGPETKRKHNKLLKQTKGFWGQRKNVYRRAKETLLRAMAFAFRGRKEKKRNMRSLFVTRITAAAKAHDTSYSVLMHNLKKSNIQLNRKMLSQLAVYDPDAFSTVVKRAQQ